MVDTVADVNLGVNLIPNDKELTKSVDKVLNQLKNAKRGEHTQLKENLSKILFRYIATNQATTGLGAAKIFEQEFGLKPTSYQRSVLRSAAGIAESGKRFVSRAEKSFLIKKQSEENYKESLLRQVSSYNYAYDQRGIDYEAATSKRMTKEQFAKMQQRTKYMNTNTEYLLAKIAKTDLKGNEEVKKLGNNFKKYSAVALKNQKELGIKGPSLLSKVAPVLSKIPGLGLLTSVAGLIGLAGKAYNIAKRSTVDIMKAHQAYGENEIDASRFDALAYRYGLEKNEIQSTEHYGADFRTRAMLGRVSPDEMLAFSLFRRAGRAAYTGGDFTAALMEDIKNLDEKQLPLARQFLSMLGLSQNLLATRKEYLSEEKSAQIDSSAKERAEKAKQSIGTYLETEANRYVVGTASMSVGTVVMKAENFVTGTLAGDNLPSVPKSFNNESPNHLKTARMLGEEVGFSHEDPIFGSNKKVVNVENNITFNGIDSTEEAANIFAKTITDTSVGYLENK